MPTMTAMTAVGVMAAMSVMLVVVTVIGVVVGVGGGVAGVVRAGPATVSPIGLALVVGVGAGLCGPAAGLGHRVTSSRLGAAGAGRKGGPTTGYPQGVLMERNGTPWWDSRQALSTVVHVLGVSAAAGLRRQVGLLLAAVAIALSLLALHQLSSNHTVAGTSAALDRAAAQPVAVAGLGTHHVPDGHAHAQQLSVAGDDHRPLGDDCPGCADHQAMLTCLAALILLVVGWVLSRPVEWRGVRLRRRTLPAAGPAPPKTPRSLSLVELSVSRT